MSDGFRLLMISAMYENGGNTTHRLLDGHPEMFVYPFESQLGTSLVADHRTSLFPVRYRWPVFALEGTPVEDYRAIIDEECKVRSRTPQVSKFRHANFDFSDDERRDLYLDQIARSGRSRPGNVRAFFEATFQAWKNHRRTERQRVYVGYSPVVVVDTDRILADFPDAHVLHVVRNPWSAFADHKKRPVPLSLPSYMLGWTLNQYYALLFREKFPGQVHLLRLEDVLLDPVAVLGARCRDLGLEVADSLGLPTWNGEPLESVYPWGTIRRATPEANRKTAEELTAEEREEVRLHAGAYLKLLGYDQEG